MAKTYLDFEVCAEYLSARLTSYKVKGNNEM